MPTSGLVHHFTSLVQILSMLLWLDALLWYAKHWYLLG